MPFPASGSPTARICQGKLTTDGILSYEKNNEDRLCRVLALYAPTNKKRHAKLHRMKVWGGRGFAVSRKREFYGKNLLKQIDDRRHFKIWKNK